MEKEVQRRRLILAAGCASGLVLVGLVLLWPGLAERFTQNQLVSAWYNWMHFPAGVVVYLLLSRGKSSVPALWAALFLLAGAEYAQQFVRRSADIVDVAWAGMGALSAFWACGAYGVRGLGRRGLLLAAAAGLLVFSLVPVGLAWMDFRRMRRQFPLLAGFESSAEMLRWEVRGCRVERVRRCVSQGRFAAHIWFGETNGAYSGMFLKHMVRDWSGAEALSLDVFIPPGEKIPFWIRVDDRRDPYPGYEERFQKRLVLHDGWNRIRVPRMELETTPSGRKLNLAQVAAFGFFVEKPERGWEIYVDNILLELAPAAGRATGEEG